MASNRGAVHDVQSDAGDREEGEGGAEGQEGERGAEEEEPPQLVGISHKIYACFTSLSCAD